VIPVFAGIPAHAIAREYLDRQKTKLSASTHEMYLDRLDRLVLPFIGSRPIASITAPDALAVLRRIEARGTHETAHRVRSLCGRIFRYAVATGRAERDPTGDRRYLFPSLRTPSRPISDGTLNAALRRLGYTTKEHTAQGFRSTASTSLNEQGWHPDLIELQLAHAERDKVRGTYNKAKRMPERRKMMQEWADYLDGLRSGAKVVPIKRHA